MLMFVYFSPLYRQNDMPTDPSLSLSVFLFSLYGPSVFCVCFWVEEEERSHILFLITPPSHLLRPRSACRKMFPRSVIVLLCVVLCCSYCSLSYCPAPSCAVLCCAPLPLLHCKELFSFAATAGIHAPPTLSSMDKVTFGKILSVLYWYCCIISEGGLKMVINENVQQIVVGKLF